MPVSLPGADANQFRRNALARWDNEGGAIAAEANEAQGQSPHLSNTELVQLRVRVIALENLLIAILAEGTERQLEVVREMSSYITPQPGSTAHPLTTQAAHLMTNLVDRAIHFRTVPEQ